MIVVFVVFNLALIAWLSYAGWKRIGRLDTAVYWSSWLLRLLCGVAMGLLYRYYYDNHGDTFTFFADASRLAVFGRQNPGEWLSFLVTHEAPVPIFNSEPRSLFFVAILSVVSFVTYDNYWISALWFSLFSWWCSYRLVRTIDTEFPSLTTAARIALLFVPSAVFWSSGIVKESLAVGAVSVLVVHFIGLIRGRQLRWHAYLEIVVFLYLLVSLKYYWAAVLAPAMVTSLIVQRAFGSKTLPFPSLAAAWVIIFGVLSLAASFTHPNFYLGRFLSVIVENHDTYLAISDPGNTIHYNHLSPTWPSIVANSPWALWSGLFRPWILEASTVTSLLASLENLLLLVLAIWKLRHVRMPDAENRVVVIATIAYVVILCIFLALSTPNLGTLSRYRVGFLPFFVLLIMADHPVVRFVAGRRHRSG